jgi:hypothetical protein
METEGYLIVLKPEQAFRAWEATPWKWIEKYPESYRTLRRTIAKWHSSLLD